MGVRIQVPDSVRGGFYRKLRWGAIGLMAHALQCDQRWLFLIRFGRWRRFGYRTHGDASPHLMTYLDGGWHWPWQRRTVGGRG